MSIFAGVDRLQYIILTYKDLSKYFYLLVKLNGEVKPHAQHFNPEYIFLLNQTWELF